MSTASMMFVPELEQAAGAAVVVILLFCFFRAYPKGYLRNWVLSYAGLAVAHLSVSVAAQFGAKSFLPFAIATNVSSFFFLTTLLLGIYEVSMHRPVSMRSQRFAIGAMALVGVAISFVPGDVVQSAIRVTLLAAGCSIGGFAVWRYRGVKGAPGFILFGVTLFGFGALQLQWLYIHIGPFATESFRSSLVNFSATVGLVLQLCVGLCMVVSVLDDEREGAVLAASEIERLAYHDALTGLPNRALFFDRLMLALAQASREQNGCAVLFLDLDHFKEINDSLGHSVGDVLLKGAAKRISDCLRQGDTLCRFGGDEFTILIPRVDRTEDVVVIAEKILHTVRVPFVLAGREMSVTTSIGISLYPGDGTDAETVVKNADAAMYRAKEGGRDRYQLYAPAMNSKALANLELESRLRNALELDELVLHYQPVFDRETLTVTGFEALLRWNHPDFGLLTPDHFMAIAERSGLILPIGTWALHRACADARSLFAGRADRLTVAVNLSARQLLHPSLVEEVKSALTQNGLEPESLELEVSERIAMQNIAHSIRALRELKNIGVRTTIDDFGTGHSSLSHLAELPVDMIKLDRGFVRDLSRPGGGAVTVAVIQMAHALGLKVTAEGVEEEQQIAFLNRHRCDLLQGYFFTKPMPVTTMSLFLESKGADSRSYPWTRVALHDETTH